MTERQRITLMAEWWPNACRAMGWPEKDRAFRIEKLSEIVGRPLASASDLGDRQDIDKVKSYLLARCDNVSAGIEVNNPAIGEARRLRHFIKSQILPCLALYEDAQSYMETVIGGLIRWDKMDRPTRPPSLDDLDAVRPIRTTRKSGEMRERASTLEQAVMTLTARMHLKRGEAGHSIHDMRTGAGLECNCRRCVPRRMLVLADAAVEPEKCPF